MYRSSSPSYSPPRGGTRRARSPSYSPPKGRRFLRLKDEDGGSTDTRRRDPSPSRNSEKSYLNPKEELNELDFNSVHDVKPNYRRGTPRSRSPNFNDEEAMRTLHCYDCDVYLRDRDSMYGHLKGYQHLKQQQRLRDRETREAMGMQKGLNSVLKPEIDSMGYDEQYWYREQRDKKTLNPEQERFLDTSRMDNVKARFNAKQYDYGQFEFKEKEMYCEVCDVWTKSRDTMEAHKAGATHLKNSAKVQRYQCTMCLITVPCQDTLDNHMRGKDHIKREKQLNEQRKQSGEIKRNGSNGYRIGPAEMAKLDNNEKEELIQLRQRVKILQEKVKNYQIEKAKCVKEHGTQELKELREKVKKCQEEHIRPKEFSRKGIFCKKEEDSSASTSSRTQEVIYPMLGEYSEDMSDIAVKEDEDISVKAENGHGWHNPELANF